MLCELIVWLLAGVSQVLSWSMMLLTHACVVDWLCAYIADCKLWPLPLARHALGVKLVNMNTPEWVILSSTPVTFCYTYMSLD